MIRTWRLPEKRDDEDGVAWCRRAAAAIPVEDLMSAVVAYLDQKERRRKIPTWSIIGEITGHGAGVSAAIADRFRRYDE